MKKILVKNGHPGSKSHSYDFSKAYVAGAKEGGATVKELQLKDLDFDPILHDGYKQRQALEPDLEKAQELIKWAEHVVIFSPIWWSAVPALLKGFIDRIILPGFAYKFTGAGRWDKYLKGKTARLVLTTGGPAAYYKLFMRAPVDVSLGYGTLKFCGFRMRGSVVVGNADKLKDAKIKKWLKKINKLGLKQK